MVTATLTLEYMPIARADGRVAVLVRAVGSTRWRLLEDDECLS